MAKRKKFEEGQAPQAASVADDSALAMPPVPEAVSPDPEKIARRAYELYLARGGEHGHAEDDWYTAERELSDSRRSGRES